MKQTLNTTLNRPMNEKNDEHYTQLADIANNAYAFDALSRPTARATGTTGISPVDSTFAYNNRSEVVSAAIGTNLFTHAYDDIGNHLLFGDNAITNTYTHNNLNQINSLLRVSQPLAAPSGFASLRQPDRYRDGCISPPRELTHSLDGGLASDGTWSYAYDAEDQLLSVTSSSLTNGAIRVLNTYDYRRRRTSKTVQRLYSTIPPPPAPPIGVEEWQTIEIRTFVYDDWNLIHETIYTIDGGTTNTTEVQYFWVLDLSDSLKKGAGGVGGLLAVSRNGQFYFPTYDNIGNITRYLDANGNTVAQYTYDAFGGTLSQNGSLAALFRHRFSTKYFDTETGLYYCDYRFYSPSFTRWLNRDPLEEDGGVNLYCFCLNDALSRVDAFGQASIADYVLANIGYDRSFPILGPYGLPVPALAARLQIHIYISGNYAECCKNGKKKKYAKGTIGAEAYLTWGAGTSRQVKGRDRNKPDSYRPGSKMKDNLTNPPDSGYRGRSWHIDGSLQNTACPESGLHFSGLTGVIFLRGSAGYGAGVQVNIQKEFRAGVDLSEGWSASLSGAWNVWGATIDFGGGGSGSWTYLQD